MGLFKKISKDKNDLIGDKDAIYNKLDKLCDQKMYDKIVETILDIPFERWSNRLWFRLISAYNNLKQFDKAELELKKIKDRCESP